MIYKYIKKYLFNSWYNKYQLGWVLSLLSALFRIIIIFRQLCYKLGIYERHSIPVPVIIVGNINIGGMGKTPLVIWLTQQLQKKGFRPGIVSRGYGGKSKRYPLLVNKYSNPVNVGDEPVIIAHHINCPIAVSPKRINSASILIEQFDCNLIISDDGLQHYELDRNIEIVVVNVERMFGNKYCLPAGPLREPISRLEYIDFLVCNGKSDNYPFNITISIDKAINLTDSHKQKNLVEFSGEDVHSIAGTGNPQRFFNLLDKIGINVIPHEFNDHFQFKSDDINYNDHKAILMTEKDAVKCRYFASSNMWYVPIETLVSERFIHVIIKKLVENNPNE